MYCIVEVNCSKTGERSLLVPAEEIMCFIRLFEFGQRGVDSKAVGTRGIVRLTGAVGASPNKSVEKGADRLVLIA